MSEHLYEKAKRAYAPVKQQRIKKEHWRKWSLIPPSHSTKYKRRYKRFRRNLKAASHSLDEMLEVKYQWTEMCFRMKYNMQRGGLGWYKPRKGEDFKWMEKKGAPDWKEKEKADKAFTQAYLDPEARCQSHNKS